MSPRFRIERLAGHDRSTFSCADPELDRYFRQAIGQDVRRRAATAFVAVETSTSEIGGFYTLSASAVEGTSLPRSAPKAPPYKRVPTALLGRLAVAERRKGIGLGSALLADAVRRAAASDIGVFAMIVQPKNERARSFYRRHGFEDADSDPSLMFLPLR